MVAIRRFNGAIEANLWKGKLAAAGIKSAVVDDVITGAAMPSYALIVREKDVGKAGKILKAIQTKRPFKPPRASIFMGLIFGVPVILAGMVYLVNQEDRGGLIMGVIFLIFGVCFTLPFFLAMIRKHK